MPDPAFALLVFASALILLAALFWPRTGLMARLLRGGRASLRVEMEDALKHLYKMEYRSGEATPESLAGALQIPQGNAARLLAQLKEAGLVRERSTARLTEEGSAYALRVIRTHRLWERYLADRTGIAPADWHADAERREHELSDTEVERLAARLGHPRYDPHGDPIPTASGELPEASGIPLTHLTAGEAGYITHLEDEPAELYDRLIRLGLAPGMSLQVVDGPAGTVRIEAGGRTESIQDGAAQNVTVVRIPVEEVSNVGESTLADLPDGEEGVVRSLSPACGGIQRRRLLDLGLVPGTTVRAELAAAGGDPRAFRVRGALIALRRDQQHLIRMEERVPAGVTADEADGAAFRTGGDA